MRTNWLSSFITIFLSWISQKNLSWESFKQLIIGFLKTQFVRIILLRIFGSIISGGYKVFIVKLIVEYAFDEIALPIIKLGFRKMGYVYHRVEGQIIFKKIEEAKANNDENKYDKAIDDLFRN